MARLNKGILGGFSGKVGTVVGGSWNGIEYIRSLPTVSKNGTKSDAQLAHHEKFRVAIDFVNAVKELVTITFKDFNGGMTGANSALAYTMQNAVAGVYPDVKIDYKLIHVSRGRLPNTVAQPVTADPAGILKFTWMDNSGIGAAKPDDKVVMVAYCEELKHCAYLVGPAIRAEAAGDLPAFTLRGKTVQTWLAFISKDGKIASPSVHTGSILVL